jgi:hypothetical protein
MSALFASGRIVDLILALVVLEAVLLAVLHRRTGRAPAPTALAPNLCAGAALLVALRCALTGAWWGWVAAALLAALVAHGWDLSSRWQR